MEENLLDLAARCVYKELEALGGHPQKLPAALQPVAILYTVQAMIDNGGFRYLFESDFPYCPPYSIFSDAYRKIGAIGAAAQLDAAVALFPFAEPETNQAARNTYMDSIAESDEFFLLGEAVCGDDRIWELMEQYVKDNAHAFPLSEK